MPIHVPLGFGGELVEATFLARPNRFLVEARLGDQCVYAHLADRGRLKETLVPGARLLLARRPGSGRKTAFQAVAAYCEPTDQELEAHAVEGNALQHQSPVSSPVPPAALLASLDTQLPNRLIELALRAGALPPFAAYTHIRREVTVGASRFDFQLSDGVRRCSLEVKSAGLVANGLALFPDAPTERGRRHVHELAALAQAGERAAVLFVAQGQAHAIVMNRLIDLAFAAQLKESAAAGVEVYGYACPLTPQGITLGPEIPVVWES